jgi:hypothetical protein
MQDRNQDQQSRDGVHAGADDVEADLHEDKEQYLARRKGIEQPSKLMRHWKMVSA